MAEENKRREKGTGSVYQKKDGSGWVGRIRSGSTTKYFSGKTEAEVKKKLRDYIKAGSPTEKKKVTVEEYSKSWLKTYKLGTVKPSTYDRLENTISHQIIPAVGSIQLHALTSDDIQKMLTDLRLEGKSHSTIKKAHDAIKAILTHAVIKEDIVKNPMLLVKMPDKSLFEQKQIRIFSEQELRLIAEEVERKYSTGRNVYTYRDVYQLIVSTGLRIGEVCALQKSDWDESAKTLHVWRNVQRVKNRKADGTADGYTTVYNTTKTYSGDRVIPLNETATEALQKLCAEHPNSEYIVCNARGEPAPPDKIDRAFNKALQRVGLEQAGVHSLRHTFASVLFSKGADVKTVSKLLGHASIQITLNTYIHMIEGADRNAVTKLDSIYMEEDNEE